MNKPTKKFELRRESFLLGETQVKAGTQQEVALEVARLASGSWTHMPVVVVHGRHPGPIVWVSGAIHGDELNGVEIVRRILQRIDPKTLSGTLLAVPIVNIFGVTIGSRYLPDRRDLNRAFPGSQRGSLTSRVARLFFDEVASRCDVGLDFHTGSGGRANYPQLRCDVDDEKTRELAALFRPPMVMHAALRDGSLRAAGRSAGVRVLVYEAGEAHRFSEKGIALGVAGAERVLHGMGMIKQAPRRPPAPPKLGRQSHWVRASRSGFAHIKVALGEEVVDGQPLAVVTDSVGKKEATVRSKAAGLVIGLLNTAHVHRGDALIHVAELSPWVEADG